jgi:U4/U6.U5 tri-snRNP-associated protein 3
MKRLREENEAEERRLLQQASSTALHKNEPRADPTRDFIARTADDNNNNNNNDDTTKNDSDNDDDDSESKAAAEMQRLLGFTGSFGTTKNSKVQDNFTTSAVGAAQKHKARKYRQYMNRKGGFNRPLDKMN